ncbi:hypothetical protein [Methanocaldococcus sp.]|uniref:hypothetical protein n=1 Tax=Methanocaldococcus sp. TaxID=2152917 RepID=UPI002614ACDC|nr:hypothetical protein [Methanocaldococcus sp.]MCQ6254486.1 hypothetical protein [Methanocaldococcus sp.]
MPTKITIELPQSLTKKEAIEILKREALKKKFKKTKLFEKYSKNKDTAYEIAEYVDRYLKRYYKDLKFDILLDYDLDEDINIIKILADESINEDTLLTAVWDVRKNAIKKFKSLVDYNAIIADYR